MRTEREIREKIDALMDIVSILPFSEDKEAGCNQIDALLWVIEDESGGELLV